MESLELFERGRFPLKLPLEDEVRLSEGSESGSFSAFLEKEEAEDLEGFLKGLKRAEGFLPMPRRRFFGGLL